MSNLKNRLQKTAGADQIATKIYAIFAEEIAKKAKEISWPKDQLDGCAEIAETNLQEAIGLTIDQIANALADAAEEWQRDTAQNYPNGPEEV